MFKKIIDTLPQESVELNVEDKDAFFVQRHLFGKTKRDIEIENLEIPKRPLLVNFAIRLIRFYQKRISKKLDNRCVFEPSCSHYSELAFRTKGILTGSILTIKRLYKCRPENGGIDDLK